MHAIEKILAKHCGKKTVTPGEIVTVNVDFAEINDLYLQTMLRHLSRQLDGNLTNP